MYRLMKSAEAVLKGFLLAVIKKKKEKHDCCESVHGFKTSSVA
jgi:hypothetical protein